VAASRIAALGLGALATAATAVVLSRYQAAHAFPAYGFPWFRALGPGEGGFYLRYLVLGTASAAVLGHGLVPAARRRFPATVSFTTVRWILSLLAVALAAVITSWVLRGAVVTDDENVYLFQAAILRHGRAAWPAPDLGDWFANVFVVAQNGRWFGQYPPGQPLLLVPFLALGLPRLLPVVLAGFNTWLTMTVARDAAGPAAGMVSGVLLIASPLFLLTSGTLLSHPAAYFGLALAAWGALRLRPTDTVAGGLALGGGLGLCLITRPYTAVTVGGVLGVAALVVVARERRPRGAAAALLAGVAFGALFLGYNAAVSGDPFVTGYQALRGPGQVELGFGPIAEGVAPHTPVLGIRNVMLHTVRFQFWSLGWPLVWAPLLSLAFLRGKRPPKDRAPADPGAVATAALAIAVGLVGYVAYWSLGVMDTGPVKLFELVFFAVVLAAVGVTGLARRAGAPVAAAAVIASLLVAATCFWPARVTHLRELSAHVRAPLDAVAETVETPAVVFTGSFQPRRPWSWVYGRPDPDPTLSDPIIYVRDGGSGNIAFLTRYPGRHPYRLRFDGDRPVVVPLDARGMEKP